MLRKRQDDLIIQHLLALLSIDAAVPETLFRRSMLTLALLLFMNNMVNISYPAVTQSAKYCPPFSFPGMNSISVEPSSSPLVFALHI